jgi:hypothetical protein
MGGGTSLWFTQQGANGYDYNAEQHDGIRDPGIVILYPVGVEAGTSVDRKV